jgi:hypothetical protein
LDDFCLFFIDPPPKQPAFLSTRHPNNLPKNDPPPKQPATRHPNNLPFLMTRHPNNLLFFSLD